MEKRKLIFQCGQCLLNLSPLPTRTGKKQMGPLFVTSFCSVLYFIFQNLFFFSFIEIQLTYKNLSNSLCEGQKS